MKACALALFLLGNLMALGQPANDEWQAAAELVIPENGLFLGTVSSPKTHPQNASTSFNEPFHHIIQTVALHQKTVWYRFNLRTARAVTVSLRQADTAIQSLDMGFTVYRGTGAAPKESDRLQALPTLTQIGSASTPCLAPGSYLVQICMRTRVQDSFWLDLALSPTTEKGNHYTDPITDKEGQLQECHSLSGAAETRPFSANTMVKSAYFSFTTPSAVDRCQINWLGKECAFILYEAPETQDSSNWQEVIIQSYLNQPNQFFEYSRLYTCQHFKPNTRYVLKVLAKANGAFFYREPVFLGGASLEKSTPIAEPIQLGNVQQGNNQFLFKVYAGCQNNQALALCEEKQHLLHDTLVFIDAATGQVERVHQVLNVGYWFRFSIAQNTRFFRPKITDNHGEKQNYASYLFRGNPGVGTCNWRTPEKFSGDCLPPGDYTMLIATHSDLVSQNDTVQDFFRGLPVDVILNFGPVKRENTQKPSFYFTPSKAIDVGVVNAGSFSSFTNIPHDYLNAPANTFSFDGRNSQGHHSFATFSLDHASYVRLVPQEGVNVHYGHNAYIYKREQNGSSYTYSFVQSSSAQFSFNTWSRDTLSRGEYLIVFHRAPSSDCDDVQYQMTNHRIETRDSFIIQQDDPSTPCVNPHQYTHKAFAVNNDAPLDQFDDWDSTQSRELQYRISDICVEGTYNLQQPHWYRYPKYKKSLQGFTYLVFMLENAANLSLFFNGPFQMLRGDIRQDSITPFKEENVLVEYSTRREEFCHLAAGTYSIAVGINTKDMLTTGFIFVGKALSKNHDFAHNAQDLGLLDQNRQLAAIRGNITCRTTYHESNPILLRNAWHTLRVKGPGVLTINPAANISHQLYQAQRGSEMSFPQVLQQNLVDSIEGQGLKKVPDGNKPFQYNLPEDRYYRFYVLVTGSSLSGPYKKLVGYSPDTGATLKGDSCRNAIKHRVNGLGKREVGANSTLHNFGGDYGENLAEAFWLEEPLEELKTTWEVLDAQDINGRELHIGLPQHSFNEPAQVAKRLFYGSCESLTPGPILEEPGSAVSLSCAADGKYFIQTFTETGTISKTLTSIEVTENQGPCRLMNLNALIANFRAEGGCDGENTVHFQNLGSGGNHVRYHWDFGDGATDSLRHTAHQYAATNGLDTYLVKLQIHNPFTGEVDSFTQKVAVGNLPLNFTMDTFICKSDTFSILDPIERVHYEWQNLDAATGNKVLGRNRSLWFKPSKDTSLVGLHARLGNCVSKDSFAVFSIGHFVDVHPDDQNSCAHDSVRLIVKKGLHGMQAWLKNEPITAQGRWVTSAGDYPVRVVYGKCNIDKFVAVDMLPPLPPKPKLDSLCEGQVVAFPNISPNYDILFYEQNGFFAKIQQSGKLPIRWMYKKGFCPFILDTLSIGTVLKDPLSFSDTLLCDDETVVLSYANAFDAVFWNTGDSVKSIAIEQPGFYIAQKHLGRNCVLHDTIVVTAGEKPFFQLRDTVMCFDQGQSATIAAPANGRRIWSSGDTSQFVHLQQPGNYWLRVSQQQCHYSDTFSLADYCPPTLFIPNAFTPNADQLNPTFKAKGTKILSFTMTIFSRNGQVVFHGKDIEDGWDGTIHGKPAPVGMYWCKVQYGNPDGDFTKTQLVHLVR